MLGQRNDIRTVPSFQQLLTFVSPSQEHEKRHQTHPVSGGGNGSGSVGGGGGVGGVGGVGGGVGAKSTAAENLHACTLCNYRCNNAGVLSSHVKVHQNSLGHVHGFADATRSDEDQLKRLAGRADGGQAGTGAGDGDAWDPTNWGPQPKLELLLAKEDAKEQQAAATTTAAVAPSDASVKVLHFCAHCPARFFVETELLIHQRFHGAKLPYRCDVCSYTARQENHLLAHWKVHGREYQERTKVVLFSPDLLRFRHLLEHSLIVQ